MLALLAGPSREILIKFLTHMDKNRPEYELLLILKFLKAPTVLDKGETLYKR
jgi:hypothetical protein